MQQILTFSRQNTQVRHPVQLQRVVNEALGLLRASIPTTIEIRQEITKDAGIVRVDTTQLHQVLLNLCVNADHAMRETGGILEVRLDAVEVDTAFAVSHPALAPGPHVRLSIRDSGHGMAPDVLERIFDPYFTTKEVGEGTGLGLAVVQGIIADHDGIVTVQSTPGEGTTFAIYLPRIDEPADESKEPETSIPHGHGCILLVDDEPAITRSVHAWLERIGYTVVSYTRSVEALETFQRAPHRFDLIITDQTMPQMAGEAFARELRRIRPDIPIILCTGFSHTMNAEKAQALGIDAFLMKPFVIRDLAMTIQQVLGQRAE